MTQTLAIVGDTHCNSKVGLLGPGILDDEGVEILQSAAQKWLYKKWLKFGKLARKAARGGGMYVIILGDALDCNTHDGFQLHEPLNEAVMVRIAAETLWPMCQHAAGVFIVRGTAAHTGGAGYLEEILAARLEKRGARIIGDPARDSKTWWGLERTFEGVNVIAAHHPGTNSMRPWTRGGAANRAAAMVQDTYYGAEWLPHLAVFAHVHHNEDSYDNHRVRAIFNRAWKLADGYDVRSGRVFQAREVGGLLVRCDAGSYAVEKLIWRLPRPKPEEQHNEV